jgi:hypothetical protein
MMVRAAMTAAAVELPADAREYLPRKWRVTDTEALRMTEREGEGEGWDGGYSVFLSISPCRMLVLVKVRAALRRLQHGAHVLYDTQLTGRHFLHECQLAHAHVLQRQVSAERYSRGPVSGADLHHEQLLLLLPGADREEKRVGTATRVPVR